MDATDFLDKYNKIAFKHNEELIEGIKSEEWSLTSFTGGELNKMTASTFHQIYGKKAATLSKAEDEYSVTLLNDLIDFCKNLEKEQDQIIDVYSFSNGDEFINVFVKRSSDSIVGSVKTKS
jgi:hypothetical protein